MDNFAPAPNLSGLKFPNLWGAQYSDYMDKCEFRDALAAGEFDNADIRAILHQGACSNTLEDDGRYMMDNNFTYSKELLHFAVEQGVPLVYASTAAVYGLSEKFSETPENERPLNVYGYSKLVFDNYLRCLMPQIKSTVVGLRYFNVYGPREQHKGLMASVIHRFTKQLKDTGTIRMFQGSGGYRDGEQRRDFVFVKGLAKINLFFGGLLPESTKTPVQAVVNAGTGEARTFKAVAEALMAVHGPAKSSTSRSPATSRTATSTSPKPILPAFAAPGIPTPSPRSKMASIKLSPKSPSPKRNRTKSEAPGARYERVRTQAVDALHQNL